MNKSALKRFAVELRRELMGEVLGRIDYLTSFDEASLPAKYRGRTKELAALTEAIERQGKEEVVEQVAYLWANRLIALRYMDAAGINQPMAVSPKDAETQPEIFAEAKAGNIDEDLPLDREKFYALLDGKIAADDPQNEAYAMLFLAVCHRYHRLMPYMFEEAEDYTELLMPSDLLSSASVRAKVVEAMGAKDCKDVEIIGWIYQFYNAEKKDEVFAALKKNRKVTPQNIPAATQLFTPHWIVKYLVENSLGRLWLRNRPNSKIKETMRYFIEQEESEDFIRIDSPEQIRLIDPCCGSGHMLTYAFDLLAQIYEEEGYRPSEIPALILEHNLYGCDIDKRAASLAAFALTMKARAYHRRFFRKQVRPKVIELQDFGSELFADIKNVGSLLRVDEEAGEFDEGVFGASTPEYRLQKQMLASRYHVCVTNPPYMGSKGMNKNLSDFVKKHYPDSKADLFAAFIERCLEFTEKDGYTALITMQSWMFLSSYEKLRTKLLKNYTIKTMAHLDNMVMGIAFGTSATIWQKTKPTKDSVGVYFKIALSDLDENREIKGLW